MNDHHVSDLKINGQGTAPGGKYNLVRINGGGKIDGDIVCDECLVNGSGDVDGAVQCNRMNVNGNAKIKGAVRAENMTVQGHASVDGDVQSGDFTVRGHAIFGGAFSGGKVHILGNTEIAQKMDAGEVKIAGACKTGGDLNAEKFRSTGQFTVGGLLSADTIDIQLSWVKSTAKEVGGETITARMGLKGLSAIRSVFTSTTNTPRFEASVIEGNDITLERTKADTVRGHNVTLGAGCSIGVVEYSGTLKKTGAVNIGQERKV